jgi:hypothetical protein
MPFKETAVSITTTERDLAAQASRDCPYCGGSGIVAIYHPRYRGHTVEVTLDGRRYAASGAAHCTCRLGLWTREHVPPDVQARIPRVEDIVMRRSKWLLEPPEYDPREEGCSC